MLGSIQDKLMRVRPPRVKITYDVETGGASLPEQVQVSIRPQSIHLLKHDPGEITGRCRARGEVQRRAYLGEYWDYYVRMPGAAQTLRVTARAQDVLEVNEPVWIEIDTAQLTVIRECSESLISEHIVRLRVSR